MSARFVLRLIITILSTRLSTRLSTQSAYLPAKPPLYYFAFYCFAFYRRVFLRRVLHRLVVSCFVVSCLSFSLSLCLDAATVHAAELNNSLTTDENVQTHDALVQGKNQLLEQLTETLHHMAALMDKHDMMNQNQLQQVAMAINQLSLDLHELSQKFQASQLDIQTLSALKKKNDRLKQEMEILALQFNDN